MEIEERIERLERLEKLRYNLKGLLERSWDEFLVIKDLKLKKVSNFKDVKEKIEREIAIIEYEI